jgi:hypothetical protein
MRLHLSIRRVRIAVTLYRLLVLIGGFGLRIDQPAMLDLAGNRLPQDLRGRF